MGSLFAKICSLLGGFGASAGSTACIMWVFDEPKMPKSLIEK